MDYSTFERETLRRGARVALVLGSGLGALIEDWPRLGVLAFSDVPDLTPPTVPGHQGEMALVAWRDQPVVVFCGRLHLYEGHPWRRVVQPVELAKRLGCSIFLATNAAGGIRADLGPGSLLAVDRHFTLLGQNSWQTMVDDARPGWLTEYYSPRLRNILLKVGAEIAAPISSGAYAQVTGPCYETRAEIMALRSLGADAVGMSTAVEIEHAHALGMECAALSCITNKAAGLGEGPIHHEEVIAAVQTAQTGLKRILDGFLQQVGN